MHAFLKIFYSVLQNNYITIVKSTGDSTARIRPDCVVRNPILEVTRPLGDRGYDIYLILKFNVVEFSTSVQLQNSKVEQKGSEFISEVPLC